MVDLCLHRAAYDDCFVLPGCEDQDLARLEDRFNSHRDRFARYVLFTEEIRGGVLPGDQVESNDTSSAFGAGAGLVEADVPRPADAQSWEIDPPGLSDGRLIPIAFGLDLSALDVAAGDV